MSENQKELLANIAPFGLRMQAELKDRLKDAAEKNNRSMNAEIIARLQWTLGPSDLLFEELLAKGAERDNRISELTRELAATKATCEELRASNFAIQKLLDESYNDAAAEDEGLSVIEKRFNALKEQTDYLENLKAELLQRSRERDAINANRQEPEVTGTPLTSELFDQLFKQLVRLEQKLDEKPEQ